MCESRKRCCEGESCGTRVDKLKRLTWALMIWVFVLSLGLGASFTFQIIFRLGSDSATSPNSNEAQDSTSSQLTLYDCFDQNMNDETELLWREKNKGEKEGMIHIKNDGNYFLFLRVTLQSPKPGVNYTVRVNKNTNTSSTSKITEERISNTKNSTEFMGIGLILTRDMQLSVICSPQAKVDVYNTYLGLMKFPSRE